MSWDATLRWLNLVFAWMQIVVTALAFGLGTSFDDATASAAGDPPIVPAGYTFLIWSVIYAGSALYSIYQFPARRSADPLLAPIRPFTASAFLATDCWLVAARFNQTGITVLCIFWLLGSLIPVFRSFFVPARALELADRWAVVIPLSIYTGWVTVATFANTSAFLHQHGLLHLVLNPAWWAVVMVSAAGVIAARWIRRSGNVAFALTVCWALIGILIASLTREYHPEVVVACATMTVLQLVVLKSARRSGPSQ